MVVLNACLFTQNLTSLQEEINKIKSYIYFFFYANEYPSIPEYLFHDHS